MTKYINTLLIAFICLWMNNDASTHDKQTVKAGLNQLFNEPDPTNYIDYAGLPQYRSKDNTNIVGRLLVIDERQLQNLKVNLDNVTVAKLNTWKDNNLDNPNHLRWDRGDSWQDVVASEGLEPVPSEEPLP